MKMFVKEVQSLKEYSDYKGKVTMHEQRIQKGQNGNCDFSHLDWENVIEWNLRQN